MELRSIEESYDFKILTEFPKPYSVEWGLLID